MESFRLEGTLGGLQPKLLLKAVSSVRSHQVGYHFVESALGDALASCNCFFPLTFATLTD